MEWCLLHSRLVSLVEFLFKYFQVIYCKCVRLNAFLKDVSSASDNSQNVWLINERPDTVIDIKIIEHSVLY